MLPGGYIPPGEHPESAPSPLALDPGRCERPSVTADVVVFAVRGGCLQVLLVRRGIPPFADRWALPGGFVRVGETVEAAADRELTEATGITGLYLEQLYTFSAPDRDPRGRVISVAHMALAPADRADDVVRGGSDAREAAWWPVSGDQRPGPLALDHDAVLDMALQRIRGKVSYTTLAFRLMAREFTLTEAQRVYEAILGRPIDKVTFRRRLGALGLVRETDGTRRGAHRPARLYTATDPPGEI